MGFFKQLFGICDTKPPIDPECWVYVDGNVEIDLSKATELAEQGGAMRLEGGTLEGRILVVHGNDGQFHAFPNRCTHIGHRRLNPVRGEALVRCCSVGKSIFDYTGKKISGSAGDPIRPYAVERKGDKLIVLLQDQALDG